MNLSESQGPVMSNSVRLPFKKRLIQKDLKRVVGHCDRYDLTTFSWNYSASIHRFLRPIMNYSRLAGN